MRTIRQIVNEPCRHFRHTDGIAVGQDDDGFVNDFMGSAHRETNSRHQRRVIVASAAPLEALVAILLTTHAERCHDR